MTQNKVLSEAAIKEEEEARRKALEEEEARRPDFTLQAAEDVEDVFEETYEDNELVMKDGEDGDPDATDAEHSEEESDDDLKKKAGKNKGWRRQGMK